MKRYFVAAALGAALAAASSASAQDIKIGLLAGKTGAFEAYAKQTEAGFMLGLERMTDGTMKVNGRTLRVISKDDQLKPDLAKSLLEQLYGDDKVDIAVGTSSSAAALAMLPVAEEYKKVLVVEPAVADAITAERWNRYIFRTARNSTQDAVAGAVATCGEEVAIATLAQDYAFGRDGVKAFKDAVGQAKGCKAAVVHEEYAPQNATDFTAPGQRLFDALRNRKEKRKLIVVIWAGAHPMNKLMDMQPQRYNIEVSPGGNILPQMKAWKDYGGADGAVYYYYAFPKNPLNDWFVAEHQKRFNAPPDFFTAGGFAAASAVVTAIKRAGSTETEKLIATMEGMEFDTPKGKMTFRKEDHQAMQAMYHFKIKPPAQQKGEWDLLSLVREIPANDILVPVRNKR